MIDVGMITSPRSKRTCDNSIEYLRRAGFTGVLHVFAEPGSTCESKGCFVHKNDKNLGCFANYHNALTSMISLTKKEYITILSDDFVYNKHTYRLLSESIKDDGYYAMYTPSGMGRLMKKRGWNDIQLGWGYAYGGLYVFPVELAKKIVSHPFYINHLENYKENKQIDHCIPEVCLRMGVGQYYHNPSFADHTGYRSTIGHKHSGREKGYKFHK